MIKLMAISGLLVYYLGSYEITKRHVPEIETEKAVFSTFMGLASFIAMLAIMTIAYLYS